MCEQYDAAKRLGVYVNQDASVECAGGFDNLIARRDAGDDRPFS